VIDVSVEFSVYKNPYNNCCQMGFHFSQYTKIDVCWGFVPDPTGGAYSAPTDPLAAFKGRFTAAVKYR